MNKAKAVCGTALSLLLLVGGEAVRAAPGAAEYEAQCAGCHQPNGEGMEGVFPALAGSSFVTGAVKDVIDVVLNGRGTAMPSFAGDMNDADLAALISYTRSSWGNQASTVTAADVAAQRKK